MFWCIKYCWLVGVFFLFVLDGCNCDLVKEKEYYEKGEVKSIITKDCYDNFIGYEHFTIDGELAFSLRYENGVPQKPFEGLPWVHIIWNKSDYFCGDSLVVEVDLASPPLLDVEFSLEDDQGIIEFSKKPYVYRRLINSDLKYLRLKAEFRLNGEKWATIRRRIDLECEQEN